MTWSSSNVIYLCDDDSEIRLMDDIGNIFLVDDSLTDPAITTTWIPEEAVS